MALKQHYGSDVAIIVADLDDPQNGSFMEEYTVRYIPAFFFIDENGVVVAEEAGVFSFEEMIARIDPLVGESVEVKESSRLDLFFSETIPAVVGQRTLLTLVIVFLGGLITSISPCILSMVPLLVSYIGGYGEGSRSRGFALCYFCLNGVCCGLFWQHFWSDKFFLVLYPGSGGNYNGAAVAWCSNF